MELNYGLGEKSEKSMAESVASLYESIAKILTTHCKLNMIAMSKMQVLGYNGFKRWHRYRSRQFHEMKLCLANELYDKFRIAPIFKDYEITYSPASMEEHLKSWDKALLDTIQELGTYNQEYYELIGMNSRIIKKAMCKIMCDYEKVGRLLKRFNESDWLTLDMHVVDDKLHEKYKEKEKAHGFKY